MDKECELADKNYKIIIDDIKSIYANELDAMQNNIDNSTVALNHKIDEFIELFMIQRDKVKQHEVEIQILKNHIAEIRAELVTLKMIN